KNMVNLVRWEPFREVISLRQAMDRLFEDSFVGLPRLTMDGSGEFPIDIYQDKKNLVVKAALPGVKPEELDITIADDILTIRGEHKEEQESEEDDYIHRERYYGAFSRSVAIPTKVKSDKAEASFEEGVLTLTLPKAGEIKPRQVKVKPKAIKAAKATKTKKAKK
ncbi:MAG: Hsp20/alpha crystallin family protein, partial [Dehalococcoidia bacterium]